MSIDGYEVASFNVDGTIVHGAHNALAEAAGMRSDIHPLRLLRAYDEMPEAKTARLADITREQAIGRFALWVIPVMRSQFEAGREIHVGSRLLPEKIVAAYADALEEAAPGVSISYVDGTNPVSASRMIESYKQTKRSPFMSSYIAKFIEEGADIKFLAASSRQALPDFEAAEMPLVVNLKGNVPIHGEPLGHFRLKWPPRERHIVRLSWPYQENFTTFNLDERQDALRFRNMIEDHLTA